ncbi:unnamed protein product [Bursaphelenchus xylophilus]|uniref:(pine wood nematode) hypothetical protein n=1 Tax=Bursaphelenchus xylophilus TaxID=6326 RepID=A0A1I7SRR1_BURXY|nr:unnamed protein product [Bursaphelenchus xylophilus]CAG9101954.1 unnamed protein product [Bursaphelenchus xylophilus]
MTSKTLFACVCTVFVAALGVPEASAIRLEYVVEDGTYVGTIAVGTPPQSANVAFDTNAGLLWVPHADCKCADECYNVPELVCYDICKSHCCGGEDIDPGNITETSFALCTRKNVFNSDASKTYIDRKSCVIANVLNQTTIFNAALDTLQLGAAHKNAPRINAFSFGHSSSLPTEYTDLKYDGVFGLARNAPRGLTTPIKQLTNRRAIRNPLVTLAFGQPESPLHLYDAELTIGEIDTKRCNIDAKNFFPTVSKDLWNGRVLRTSLNNSNHADYLATIDISTPYIHFPNTLFGNIQKNSKYDELTDTRTMDCDLARRYLNRFAVNFGFGDLGFNTDLIVRPDIEYQGKCKVMLKPAEDNAFVLGLPFLHRKCVVLDLNGRIGVADYREPDEP